MSIDNHIEVSGKLIKIRNEKYKSYTAEYAKYTKLPMYGGAKYPKQDYEEVKDIYLSSTRCREIGKSVGDNEEPVAWYRVMHGYVPLYLRAKDK